MLVSKTFIYISITALESTSIYLYSLSTTQGRESVLYIDLKAHNILFQ